jgi:predicted acetyltransferase
MNIEIVTIKLEEKDILSNLLELYLYDFSEFTGFDLGIDGRYNYKYRDNYWMESNRFPLFIKIDDKIAGFVLINLKNPETKEKDIHTIAEFFVMKKYRLMGVGKNVANQVFDKFHGKWEIMSLTSNIIARQFWKKVVEEYTKGNFQEIKSEKGPVLVFSNLN